jgi:REP element-mobilizing transposase RayT
MTTARQRQVHLDTTPYYHCMARCVRRAFLCGEDHFSGKNYDHRKQWIVGKLKALGGLFAVDICAYAVMSNHYHVVLRVDAQRAKTWSDKEVIDRWCSLFKGPMLVDRLRQGDALSRAEYHAIGTIVAQWRTRLSDISWFMRCLNEHIAREANQEDGCKGRFWEGRFKSQALLDEAALLTCMMYVDLNPIRAGLCDTPEASDYTSIQERIIALGKQRRHSAAKPKPAKQKQPPSADAHHASPYPPAVLVKFEGDIKPHQPKATHKQGIPFFLTDYLDLIDWTGRAVRDDKKGAIPPHLQSILVRLNINDDEWVTSVQHFGRRFYGFVGSVNKLRRASANLGKHWVQGLSHCAQVFERTSVVSGDC